MLDNYEEEFKQKDNGVFDINTSTGNSPNPLEKNIEETSILTTQP